MTEGILFKNPEHKQRLLRVMQELGKVDSGRLDPEYASALYLFAADLHTWQQAQGYISATGIDFEAMLDELDFSGGYRVLVTLAGNLFNNQQHLDPLELLRLDDSKFDLALSAIRLRRNGLRVDDFK